MGESEIGLKLTELLLQNELLPDRLKTALTPRIQEIVSGPPQGLMTLAIVGAIWTASSAVEGIRTILNRAYRVSTPPAYILRRLMSILQFLIITAILIIVMLLLIVTPIIWDNIAHFVTPHLPQGTLDQDWDSIRYAFTSIMIFLTVSSIFYVLPNIKQRWNTVFPGAILVVIGWTLAAELFTFYLSTFDQVSLIYGSLGGIIVALLFFYILSTILILGAEFNYRFTKTLGEKIKPKETHKK